MQQISENVFNVLVLSLVDDSHVFKNLDPLVGSYRNLE